MRLPVAIALAALFAVPTASLADVEHRSDRLIEGAKILNARDAYQARCAACHGEAGDGRGTASPPASPRDFTSPAAVADLTREAMIEAVRDKHDAAARAGWESALDAEDVAAVIDYIREAFMLPAPVADASLGRTIYARTCSVCHGERGNAASWAKNSLDPPPVDFTTTDPRKLTAQRMFNTVLYGSTDTAMVPFATQFSREEIAAVVSYIRQNFMKMTAEPAVAEGHGAGAMPGQTQQAALGQPHETGDEHARHGHTGLGEGDMDAPFPGTLVGDYEAGKAFFKKNCVECHGEKGDGDGRRAYFMVRKPQNFTSARSRAEFNRPHLFKGIAMGVVGSEMPAWSKVLDAQQIADVAEYVFGAFISPERSGIVPRQPQWQGSDAPAGEHGHDAGSPAGEHSHDAETNTGEHADPKKN